MTEKKKKKKKKRGKQKEKNKSPEKNFKKEKFNRSSGCMFKKQTTYGAMLKRRIIDLCILLGLYVLCFQVPLDEREVYLILMTFSGTG